MRKYSQETILLFVGVVQRLFGKIALSADLFDVLLNGADFAPVSNRESAREPQRDWQAAR
jgi:hypothetical protein